MPTMLRKQIYIAPRQERLLKTKASELHISESGLIREGIDKALQTGASTAPDQIPAVLSENFSHNPVIEGVRFTNPFKR